MVGVDETLPTSHSERSLAFGGMPRTGLRRRQLGSDPDVRSARRPLVVAGLIVGVLLASCGGTTAPQATTTSTAPQPGPGAPHFCDDLAGALSLRNLSVSVQRLRAGDTAAAVKAQMNSAASILTKVSNESGAPTQALIGAATALRGLAAGSLSATRAEEAELALTQLGTEIQSSCHFPLG